MNLFPVALALFHRWNVTDKILEVWVQRREDDGPFHGLLEFPGGGIEPGEQPLLAAVREVEEEVGIKIDSAQGKLMGIYPNEGKNKTVLLYVFLFPDQESLDGKGQWLQVDEKDLSGPHTGLIPPPNHRIINDLWKSRYGV